MTETITTGAGGRISGRLWETRRVSGPVLYSPVNCHLSRSRLSSQWTSSPPQPGETYRQTYSQTNRHDTDRQTNGPTWDMKQTDIYTQFLICLTLAYIGEDLVNCDFNLQDFLAKRRVWHRNILNSVLFCGDLMFDPAAQSWFDRVPLTSACTNALKSIFNQ